MLVRRGLPAPRNKKRATPLGKEGELLGGPHINVVTTEVNIQRSEKSKQYDKERNSKLCRRKGEKKRRNCRDRGTEGEGEQENSLHRREVLIDLMMGCRQEI